MSSDRGSVSGPKQSTIRCLKTHAVRNKASWRDVNSAWRMIHICTWRQTSVIVVEDLPSTLFSEIFELSDEYFTNLFRKPVMCTSTNFVNGENGTVWVYRQKSYYWHDAPFTIGLRYKIQYHIKIWYCILYITYDRLLLPIILHNLLKKARHIIYSIQGGTKSLKRVSHGLYKLLLVRRLIALNVQH